MSQTVIPLTKLQITSKKEEKILIDEHKITKTPCIIEKFPRSINFIVGKGRKFNLKNPL